MGLHENSVCGVGAGGSRGCMGSNMLVVEVN